MSFGLYQGQSEGALGRLAFTLGADGIQQLEADMNRAEGIINKFGRTQQDVAKKVTQYQKEITDGAKKQAADIERSLERMRKANEGLLSQKEVNSKWAKEIEGIRATITETQKLKVAESDRVVAAATATNRWTEATKQAATKQVEIVKVAANTNVSTWSQMWTRFKIASYPAQAEFLEMMNRMSSGVKGFSGQAIFRGLLSGLGIGSAMAMVSAAINDVIDRIGEADRTAKEFVKTSDSMAESWRRFHAAIRETQISKLELPEQAKAREDELVKAEDRVRTQAEEIAKLTKAQQDVVAGTLETAVYKSPYTVFYEKLFGDKQQQEDREKLLDKVGADYRTGSSALFNLIGTQIEKERATWQELINARNEAAEKLRLTNNNLTERAGGTLDMSKLTEPEREAIRKKSRDEAIEGALRIEALENAAEERHKRWQESLRQTATNMRAILDPTVAFKEEMFEITTLAETVDQRTGKTFITAQQAAELADQARTRRDNRQLQIAEQSPESVAGRERQGRIDRFVGMTQLENPGFAGDIQRLDDMKAKLDEEMNILEEHMEADEDLRRRHAERVAEIERQKNSLLLLEAAGTAGMLADVTAMAFGEQSGAYKAMFAISKAFAIAEATIALQLSVAKAAAVGWPANIALIAQAVAQGTSIISNMQAIALSFDGGGMTPSGPRVGGVDGKGGMPAIVHPDEAIIDLTKSQSRGMGGGGENVVVNFNQTFTGGVTQTDLARQLEVQKRETISAVGLAVERGGSFRRQIRG